MGNGAAAVKGRSGFTNSPFAKNVITFFPMIRWIAIIVVGAVFAYMTLWIRLELFTRDEGEALKLESVTQSELKEVKDDIEVLEDQQQGIKTEIHGFKIEQRHTNEQLSTVIRMMEIQHSRSPPP